MLRTNLARIVLLLQFALVPTGFAQNCADCDGNGVPESVEQSTPNGLVAQYFRSQSAGLFTERLLPRIDANIDFNWEGGSPDAALASDNFAVRWTGTLLVPATGIYTFSTRTDDGVRLWIDDVLLIDKWQPQSPTTWSATISLAAGTRVPLRMEYYEGGGGAEAALRWIVPGGVAEAVPTTVLEPMTDLDDDGWPDTCGDCNGNGIVDAQEIRDGLLVDCNGNCIGDACEIAGANTIGYWRAEEASGSLLDASGNALNGTPTNMARTANVGPSVIPATAAANTQSASLGASGRFVVADPSNLLASGGASFTIEAWVKVDTLAQGATATDRRIVLQRKALTAGDKFADYMLFAQGGDMPSVGIANYGRTCCFNGRELVLVFGNGGAASASFWTVTSNFRIEDTEWHYVSAAFSAETNTVRLVLDDTVETVPVLDRGHVSVSAPLLVGMHTNSSGQYNQPLLGMVDEVRVSAGYLPRELLLSSASPADCNANGVPDGCDIAAGASDCDEDGLLDICEPDCNANGTPDDCDLAGGESQDCNADGVPDDCQLAGNDCDSNGVPDDCQLAGSDCNENGVVDYCDLLSGDFPDCNKDGVIDACQIGQPLQYRIDDGGAEFGVRADGNNMAWMNQFRVQDGAMVIETIDVMFVFAPTNQLATVYVWSDPDGDGSPVDARVLASVQIPIATLGVWQTIDLPDTLIGPNGTSFFVGAITTTTTADFPGPIDSSGSALSRRSWIVGSSSPIDPNDLSAGVTEFETVEEALPFPGKWLVRATGTANTFDCNGNGVPDPCDIEAGTSADADASGKPDECEDCNTNGTLDSSDISAGTSLDCQPDGIPDECQVIAGDCNADGIPDGCQLGDNDCNGNGVPDDCDIASGSSSDSDATGRPDECEDCNRNGVLDSADVLAGTSADCNLDRVPDECQLGDPLKTVEYAIDDGTRDGNYGFGGVVDMVWLNQFFVAPGAETIRNVKVVIGNAFAGQPYRVAVWSDPNGNAQPEDSQVLAIADAIVANGNTSIFNVIEVPATYIGPAGTSFFVGVLYRDAFGNQFPIGVDTATVSQRSWVAAGPTVDPNNLSIAPTYGYFAQATSLIRADGYDGVLSNDCNGNLVPDECEATGGCGPCPSDFNRDGEVSSSDLAVLLSAWGAAGGDLNGDGTTSSSDLAILLSAWGPCP